MEAKKYTCMVSVFIGCCVNVLVLEKLITSVTGIANLITFLQFIFISLEGFLITIKCGRRRSLIPVRSCLVLVCFFFISSVCNNYAYNLNVPNSLHIIIKSGSLLTNMIVGGIYRRKKYSIKKKISVAMVTAGIIIYTMASAKNMTEHTEATESTLLGWLLGVFLLVFALVVGAFMGLLQESIFADYGKHPNDMLFYTHLLPLPLFVFLGNDLKQAFISCSESDPIVWLLLCWNVFTQYVCIRSVYILASEYSPLTVTMVLTLRKFSSLLFSALLFDSYFTFNHCFGTFIVIVGTLLYTFIN